MAKMDYESFISLINSRRSCRRFRPDPIPDDHLNKIIEAAHWAPSGANSQPWDFVIVRRKELRKNIFQFVREFLSVYYNLEHTRARSLPFPSITKPITRIGYEDAPVFIILCGDRRTKLAYPLYAAVELSEAILESSLANAFLYMQLAANTLGLGA